MDQETYINQLIAKQQAGTLNEVELKVLLDWYNGFDDSQVVLAAAGSDNPEALKARMYHRLMARIKAQQKTVVRNPLRWLRYTAAAVLLLSVSVGIWFYRDGSLPPRHDFAPGGNRATLTLADGRTFDLSETQAGIVVGAKVTYLDGSDVLANNQQPVDSRLLSLATPKGGTYQITLPDGSKVWLNANSRLHYPSQFSTHERLVELEGEAYFDVRQQNVGSGQHAAKVPFKVQTVGQVVEVLGTEFNISAYGDDTVTRTTLVEGAVRLEAKATGAAVSLARGEQAQLVAGSLTKATIDTEPYVAWKNGYFLFANTPLSSIASQLAKWYDIQVLFDEPLQNERFYGMIDRHKHLSQVLSMLEKTQAVRFWLEGNTLHITKR